MSEFSERISNTIFLKQTNINEMEKLKDKIDMSEDKEVRFRIETKHWYGYGTNAHLGKKRTELPISKKAIKEIIDVAIEREREYIDKLIEIEVDSAIQKQNRKEN